MDNIFVLQLVEHDFYAFLQKMAIRSVVLCPLNGNLGNFHYLTKDSTVDSHVCSVGLLSVFVKGLFLGPPFRNSTQLHVSVSNRSFSEFGGRMLPVCLCR